MIGRGPMAGLAATPLAWTLFRPLLGAAFSLRAHRRGGSSCIRITMRDPAVAGSRQRRRFRGRRFPPETVVERRLPAVTYGAAPCTYSKNSMQCSSNSFLPISQKLK